MKDLTPKADDTSGPTGQLIAIDFNDARDDAQNLVTGSGQALTAGAGDNNEQLLNAVVVGGRRVVRGDAATSVIGDIVIVDNSGGAVTINLPDPDTDYAFTGGAVVFEPVAGDLYSVNSLTIGRNGKTIMGLAEDLVMNSTNSDNQRVRFSYDSVAGDWLISLVSTVGIL